MRNLILFLVLSLLASLDGHGQGWSGARQIPGVDGWICKKDNEGNIYASGVWEIDSIVVGTTVYHNYNVGTNNYQAVIAKYDHSGNVLWSSSSLHGQAWPIDIATDKSGNMYFFGCFWTDSVTFGQTTLVNSHVDSCLQCLYADGIYFILKFDSLGNIVWAKTGDNISSGYMGWRDSS